MTRTLICAIAVALSGVGLAAPSPDAAVFREAYFAPITSVGLWRMRMESGAIREFEARGKADVLHSVDGWTARLRDWSHVTVKSGPRVKPVRTYEFENGTLKRCSIGRATVCPDYREPVVYEDETICPLWPDIEEVSAENRHFVGTWELEKNRLKLWFEGPNQAGAFLSFVFLAFAILALFVPRAWIRWPCAALALATLWPIIRTDSRGTVVATFATLIVLIACRLYRSGRRPSRAVVIRSVLLIALVIVGVVGGRLLTTKRTSYTESNEIRKQVWQAVPKMMCDAPWGWGPNVRGAGKAYSRWYVPFEARNVQYSLVNDHLTILVSWGWLRGGVYLAFWAGGLWLLWAFAFRGGSPLPAAWWTSLGICSFFNVVLFVPLLHWLPVLPLATLAFDRRWMERRILLVSSAVGVICSVGILGAFACFGDGKREGWIPLHRDGTIIELNGMDPKICIVDDRESLGAISTTGDLRRFYSLFPHATPMAYATDLQEALAHGGYQRLVVAGKRGTELLDLFKTDPDQCCLPPEVFFLAPPFPPSELPVDFHARTKVEFVIGEFHARYYPELARPQPDVTIVRGAEMFIPGWMRYCLKEPIL